MTTQEISHFRHAALPFGSNTSLVDLVADFLRPALTNGEPVFIVAQSKRLPGLRRAFEAHRDHMEIAPMEDLGRNPGRLISLWHEFMNLHGAADRTIWGVGEPIYPGRDPAEIVEGQIHERLLNEAFGGSEFPLSLGCPYDTDALPSEVIEEMRRSHPLVGTGPESHTNELDHLEKWALGPQLPPALIADDAFEPFTKEGLGVMRKRLSEDARRLGLDDGRIPDLLLAVNEIATNSIAYAGSGSLGLWRDGGRLVCEVRDRGFIENALVGRRRPGVDEGRGRGIWFAHQVADLVQLRSQPSGTTVRILFDCDSGPRSE